MSSTKRDSPRTSVGFLVEVPPRIPSYVTSETLSSRILIEVSSTITLMLALVYQSTSRSSFAMAIWKGSNYCARFRTEQRTAKHGYLVCKIANGLIVLSENSQDLSYVISWNSCRAKFKFS